ncbi:hypothetical protein IV203_032850 [Nitzschia inconspicua]|uniref:Uncharacterized protein n=1 Tax=Nitzschia inconspicua TaxID=303405 RepID=A0A9K3KKA3_9STRA|nr:hypothetical protein IV203_032850 [Nitzschia inconspicua]
MSGEGDGLDDVVSYSTGASRSDDEDEESSSRESADDDSSSDEDSTYRESSSSDDVEASSNSETDDNEAESSSRTRTSISTSNSQSTGESTSKPSRSSRSRSSFADGGSESRSSQSHHENEKQQFFQEDNQHHLKSKHLFGGPSTHSSSRDSTSGREEANSGIMSTLGSVEEDDSSADYTSGSDSTYDESEKSSSAGNDDSSRMFSSPWSPLNSNTFANAKSTWPIPEESPKSNAAALPGTRGEEFSSPGASSISFANAKDADPFAATPSGDETSKLNSVSSLQNLHIPPFAIDKTTNSKAQVTTVGFDIEPKKDHDGSEFHSSRSNRSNQNSTKSSNDEKSDDWFEFSSNMGSSKGSAKKSTSTRTSPSGRSRSARRDSGKEQSKYTDFELGSEEAFRSEDPSGMPPPRVKSYNLTANVGSMPGSEIDDSSSRSKEAQKDNMLDSNYAAFGFGEDAAFFKSTTFAFSASSNLQSSAQDIIDGFGSIANAVVDDSSGLKNNASASLSRDPSQSHSGPSTGSIFKNEASMASSVSKFRSNRSKPKVSHNSQSQTSIFSKPSQRSSTSLQSSAKLNHDSSRKGSRISISEFLPPRPIGNEQMSVVSGLSSKDTINRAPLGDEPSISLSDVFSQRSPHKPSHTPPENSRKKESFSSPAPPTFVAATPPNVLVTSNVSNYSIRSSGRTDKERIDVDDSSQAGPASSIGLSSGEAEADKVVQSTRLFLSDGGSHDNASAKANTNVSGGAMDAASQVATRGSKETVDSRGNVFGSSFHFDSVQSNVPSGKLNLLPEGLDISAKSWANEKEALSFGNLRDSSASISTSSPRFESSERSGQEETTDVSVDHSKLGEERSNCLLKTRLSSKTLGSGASFSQVERTSITTRSSKSMSSSHTSNPPSMGSISGQTSYNEASNKGNSKSPPSSSGRKPTASRSHGQPSRSRRGLASMDNSKHSAVGGSTTKHQITSRRPQSAGDSSHEGSSRESTRYTSKSHRRSIQEQDLRSSRMSTSAAIVMHSSGSEDRRSATSRSGSRPKPQNSRSRWATSHGQDSRRNRMDRHGASTLIKEVGEMMVVPSKKNSIRLPDIFFFGKGISLLKEIDVGLKKDLKVVHATVSSLDFQNVVSLAYEKLCQVRPRLSFLLSKAEWLHVHCLLLYARLFDCELYFHKIDLPKEFQIEIPQDIQVLEPIAAALASIGIVEDNQRGVTYVPVPKPYEGETEYAPHDPEDVTEFLEWTQKGRLGYDWNASWEKVEVGRRARKQQALGYGVKLPMLEVKIDTERQDEKLKDWNLLAVEKWLGWDDELWYSYQQACHVLSRIADFSPFSREVCTGSYAWLLPRKQDNTGAIVRVPTAGLTADSWMVAVLFNFCALTQEQTSTWYLETKLISDVKVVTSQFLESGIKMKSGESRPPNGRALNTAI